MARQNQGVNTTGFEKKLSEFMGLRDSNTLWRITSWGVAAALALTAAVLLTTTDSGSQRLQVALAPNAATPAGVAAQVPKTASPAKVAELPPAPAGKNPDTERLEAQIRELADDRDRLKARVASLEQNLNDMTGSIKRELALVAATAPAPEPKLAPKLEPKPVPTTRIVPPPALTAPQTEPPEQAEAAKETEKDATPTARAGAPLMAEGAKVESKADAKSRPSFEVRIGAKEAGKPKTGSGAPLTEAKADVLKTLPGMAKITAVPLPPLRVATATEPAAPAAVTDTAASPSHNPELGIELGGARSMEILKKRWAAVKTNFGPLVKGLHPLMTYDRRNPRIPYRLLVGPLPNGATVAQTCKRFAASRVSCRAVPFIGELFAEK